jgi:hypothetical protein
MKTKCEICGKEFLDYRKRRYCSDNCKINRLTKIAEMNKSDLIKYYNEGWGIDRLSKKFNMNRATIWLYLKRWDVPVYKNEIDKNEDFWYILGIMYGDGYSFIAKNGIAVIGLETKDKEFAESFLKSLRNLGLARYGKNLYKFPKKTYKQGYGWMAKIASKDFYELIKKTKLESIRNENDSNKIAFIRGLYESEGYLSSKHLVVIYNTNIKLIKLSEYILSEHGFAYAIHGYKLPSGKIIYNVRLRGDVGERERFLKLVKPTLPRKSSFKDRGGNEYGYFQPTTTDDCTSPSPTAVR